MHPIGVGGDVVGQLEIEGDPAGDSTLAHMIQVLDFLEPIEGDVQHIMEEIQHDQATVRVGSVAASRRTVQTTTATSEPTADPVSTAPIDPAVGSTAVTPAAAQQVTANE